MDALRLAPLSILIIAILAVSPALAQTDCTANNPEISISPSKISALPGDNVVFTVHVQNEDSDNCGTKEFGMTGQSEVGSAPTFSPTQIFLRPDETETTLMTVKIPSDATVGTYVAKAFATAGALTDSATVTVEVLQDVEECEVKVSNLRFKESSEESFKSEFAQDDEVSVLADVSLLGNVNSDILLQLFVEGKVVGSETEPFTAGSDTTVRFSERILTKDYVDNVDVKVVATASCNPSSPDEDTDTIEIKEGDEDIEVEVDVGTPGNTIVGKEVSARIFVENTGEKEARVNVDARLCTSGSSCKLEMFCGDSIVLVDEDDTEEILCSAIPTVSGKYRVEVFVSFDTDQDVERSDFFTVASSESELAAVKSGGTIQPGAKEPTIIKQIIYSCSGDVRQAVYITTDGNETSDIEFCPFGCRDGICVQSAAPAKKQTSATTGDSSAREIITEPKFSQPTFNLDNFFDWLKNLLFGKTNLE